MRKKKTGTPWWLTRGTELCDHCLQLYHYHVQHRCAECDGALCPSCVTVVHATRTSYCAECVPSASDASVASNASDTNAPNQRVEARS